MARRKHTGEPSFGSDSFLDVVANLVGIVLIIIVLVAARVRELPGPTVAAEGANSESQPSALPAADPRWPQLQAEIADLQVQYLVALRKMLALERGSDVAGRQHLLVQQQADALENARRQLERRLDAEQADLAEFQRRWQHLARRGDDLQRAIESLENTPANRRTLRYHLPVSEVVAGGEVFFECKNGRVTFIDLQPMLEEMRRGAEKLGETLRTQWEAAGSVAAHGPFRLEYTLSRTRQPDDPAIDGLNPTPYGGFQYRLARWELVPVDDERGQELSQALKPGAEFRRVVDRLNPEQVVLTFWVYEDSFNLFRELRDYLHERGFVVAGRPLPEGARIGGAPSGTASRGQ